MKKLIIAAALFVFCSPLLQAQDEGQGVDLLKSPASPAAQLLNMAPNTIERPTDLTSFWLSINKATNNLNKLPGSYAFDVAPASLFKGPSVTLKSLTSRKLKDILWQSLVISAGFKSEEDSSTQQDIYKAGVGFKVSFIRGDWSATTTQKYNALNALQQQLTDRTDELAESIEDQEPLKQKLKERDSIRIKHGQESAEFKKIDSVYNALRLVTLSAAIDADATSKVIKDNLKLQAKDFHIDRVGWFLDLAGGFSAQFPTNQLGYSIGDRSGAWFTGGYEGGEKHLSILGIARYLYQPETIFADPTGTIPTNRISTFDAGTRILYATQNDQFNFSFESIYRSILGKSILDPSWKLVFSAEYDLGFNQKLTFNFGRDFDGTVSKGGNLIAAVNFIAGFGNKKALK